MILLALLLPAAMMALLFGITAYEEHLFPQPTASDDTSPPTDQAKPQSL
ncbi:hypothetical protein ABTY98_05165 [Streptomyces sp. NPDC096040]